MIRSESSLNVTKVIGIDVDFEAGRIKARLAIGAEDAAGSFVKAGDITAEHEIINEPEQEEQKTEALTVSAGRVVLSELAIGSVVIERQGNPVPFSRNGKECTLQGQTNGSEVKVSYPYLAAAKPLFDEAVNAGLPAEKIEEILIRSGKVPGEMLPK